MNNNIAGKHFNNESQNTIKSKSSCSSSDTEPFYLHPPTLRNNNSKNEMYKRNASSSPPELYGSVLPNDGLYINPMRNGFATPPSPGGSISGESFYLHDPQEVIYNRVKDLFDSDGSHKDGSNSGREGPPNALTVQADVHSSSSGAGSGSEESLSVASDTAPISPPNKRTTSLKPNAINNNNNNPIGHEHHDYEDIYLVREEARGVPVKNKFPTGRSRSRDSGSHSRSASASSAHSTDIIVQYMTNVWLSNIFLIIKINFICISKFQNKDTISSFRTNDTTQRKYDSPRKGDYSSKNSTYNSKIYNNNNGMNNNSNSNNSSSNHLNNNNNNNNHNTNTLNTIDTYESVCSPEDIYERTKMAQRHTLQSNHSSSSSSSGASTSRLLKRVVSAPQVTTESQGEISFFINKLEF